MKIKMRENSLFAILLRSPWWYSIAIGGFVTIFSVAVLGPRFSMYGIAIAIPFFGLGTYAFYKQAQRPSVQKIAETDAWIRKMPAREFTAIVTKAYEDDGYVVVPYKGKAAELLVEKENRQTLVSCKRVKAASHGTEPLEALIDAGDKEDIGRFTYFALSGVSQDAAELAHKNYMDIYDAEVLTGWLARYNN